MEDAVEGCAVVFLVEEGRGGAVIEEGRTTRSGREASEEVAEEGGLLIGAPIGSSGSGTRKENAVFGGVRRRGEAVAVRAESLRVRFERAVCLYVGEVKGVDICAGA